MVGSGLSKIQQSKGQEGRYGGASGFRKIFDLIFGGFELTGDQKS